MSIKVNVDVDTKIILEKCPHILIGGSTGSGKSYLIKNMLCDILKSGEAKVIVIDPKSVDFQFLENGRRLEWDDGKELVGLDGEGISESEYIKRLWMMRGLWLGVRDDIDSLKVNKYLNELVRELYRRYNYMKKYGYVDWSEVLEDEKKEKEYDEDWDDEDRDEEEGHDEREEREESREYRSMFGNKRIVLVVDELADLIYWDRAKSCEMLVGYEKDVDDGIDYGEIPIMEYIDSDVWKMIKGTIEGCLIKLSILGRAAGIHLILGTQRPDASILSGQLRANLPCRICLRVSNKLERRIILGDSGRGYEREMKYLSEDYVLKYRLR